MAEIPRQIEIQMEQLKAEFMAHAGKLKAITGFGTEGRFHFEEQKGHITLEMKFGRMNMRTEIVPDAKNPDILVRIVEDIFIDLQRRLMRLGAERAHEEGKTVSSASGIIVPK